MTTLKAIKVMSVWLLACFCGAFAVETEAAPGLTITIGQPFTIAKSEQYRTWGYWNHPTLQKCANGDLRAIFGNI